jgi:propanol-preferring alcohol dehydrogenase
MQAFQLIEWQQPPVLRDVPVPELGPSEVLVKVGGPVPATATFP